MDDEMSSRVVPDDDEGGEAESPVVVNNNNGDSSSSSSNNNIFKQCHNHHKRHPHNLDRLDDLNELLDFRRRGNDDPQNNNKSAPYIRRIDVDNSVFAVDADKEEEGMEPREEQRRRPGEEDGLRCFGLSCYSGFLFFPAALDDNDQTLIRRLAYYALTEYCEAPYRTNIEQIAPKSSEIIVPPTNDDVTTAATDATIIAAASTSRSSSMWDLWVQQQEEPKHRPPPPLPRYYRCLEKLSWATLGYFYDWSNRCYHENDHHHSGQQNPLLHLLPPELVALSRVFANISLGLEQANNHNNNHREKSAATTTSGCHYNPSACIVNYYGSV
jgi:hypothetical protein